MTSLAASFLFRRQRKAAGRLLCTYSTLQTRSYYTVREQASNYLVDASWVDQNLDTLQVVDGTWYMPGTSCIYEEFNKCRIPNSVLFDLDHMTDNSTLPHMMPALSEFKRRVTRELQLDLKKPLVVYDRQGVFSSCRVWWMLKLIADADVFLLDGGLVSYLQNPAHDMDNTTLNVQPPKSREASGEQVSKLDSSYNQQIKNYVVSQEQVFEYVRKLQRHTGGQNTIGYIFDARSKARFDGEAPEPRPTVRSGHIPYSVSVPYASLLQEKDQRFKSNEEIKQQFQLDDAKIDFIRTNKVPIIFTCGSGVTACVNYFALYNNLNIHTPMFIYDGSFTEWGDQNSNTPVEITATVVD